MAKTPETGTAAPDFTLPGVLVTGGTAERADYTLSAHRGMPVVLAFYPGDNTSVCTKHRDPRARAALPRRDAGRVGLTPEREAALLAGWASR